MEIETSYIYQVFKAGRYLGNMPTPRNEFGYSQNVNTVGAQIDIVVPINADTAPMLVTTIDDETGDPLETESGEELTIERVPDVVGSENEDALFQSGNVVKVYEISTYNPNGVLVFSGKIKNWRANMGSDDDTVTVRVYSTGEEFNDVLVPGSNPLVLDQSQTGISTYIPIRNASGWFAGVTQLYYSGASVTRLAAVTIRGYAASPVTATCTIKASISGPTIYGSASQSVTNTSNADITFTFATPIDINPSQYYVIKITNESTTTDLYVGAKTDADAYASGWGAALNYDGTYTVFSSNGDLYFKTYDQVYTTKTTYTSQDPSTILTTVMDYYIGAGGGISKQSGGYSATGVTATHTFNINTIQEAIQTVYSYAPNGWYYYTDLSTDELIFREVSADADYVLVKGVHIQELDLAASIENIANLVYFSGGEVSGSNIFRSGSDATSIAEYGQKIARLSNTGVLTNAAADLIIANYIDANKDEQYQTEVVITREMMDISQIRPGQTVRLNGYGNFIDRLILQIARIDYRPGAAKLLIGTLPKSTSTTVKQLENDLLALQQFGNPNAPS